MAGSAAELTVRAPFGGHVVDLSDVPDDIFSGQVLGHGVAIWPERERIPVVAPIAGLITAWHPHACVISPDEGIPILVHLGLDTVALQGRGFAWHVAKDSRLAQGQLMCAWDTSKIENFLPITPIVAMGEAHSITRLAGEHVEAGESLYSVTAP